MLIEIITKSETKETREVTLPYYSKLNSVFYCIADEENVIRVHSYGVANFGKTDLTEAASGAPVSEAEFLAAWIAGRAKTEFKLPGLQIPGIDMKEVITSKPYMINEAKSTPND